MDKKKVYYFLLVGAALFFLSAIGVWHNGHFKVSPVYSDCIYTPACQCCYGNCGFDCDSGPTDTPTPTPPPPTITPIPKDTVVPTPTPLEPTPVPPSPTPNTCGASNQPNRGGEFSLQMPGWLTAALDEIDSDSPFPMQQGLKFNLSGYTYDCCDMQNIRNVNGRQVATGGISAFVTVSDIPFPGGGVSDFVHIPLGPDGAFVSGLVSAGVRMNVGASIAADLGWERSLCVFPTSNCYSARGAGSGQFDLKVGGKAELTYFNPTAQERKDQTIEIEGIQGTISSSISINGSTCSNLIHISFAAPEVKLVSAISFAGWDANYVWAKWEGKGFDRCVDQSGNLADCPPGQ